MAVTSPTINYLPKTGLIHQKKVGQLDLSRPAVFFFKKNKLRQCAYSVFFVFVFLAMHTRMQTRTRKGVQAVRHITLCCWCVIVILLVVDTTLQLSFQTSILLLLSAGFDHLNAKLQPPLYRYDFDASASSTTLMWVRGLAYSCDFHGGDLYPVTEQLSDDAFVSEYRLRSYFSRPFTVFLHPADLSRFNRLVLPTLSFNVRFVLITSSALDMAVPSDVRREAETMYSSGFVLHWFAVNYDGQLHANDTWISPIPIGLNLHSLAIKGTPTEYRQPPQQQEHNILSTRTAAHTSSSDTLVFADFHLQNRQWHTGSREQIYNTLKNNPLVHFLPHRIPRPVLWILYAHHRFVLCPHGDGLDTYRVWEVLALGSIPIVKRSTLDAMYDDLPVVIVNDWTDITEPNLQHWMASLHTRKYPTTTVDLGTNTLEVNTKLTMRYWLDKIKRFIN